MAIADRITVLRRGAVVGRGTPQETSPTELVVMMIGDAAPQAVRIEAKSEESIASPIALEFYKVSTVEGNQGVRLKELSFNVRAGEILGVAGVWHYLDSACKEAR